MIYVVRHGHTDWNDNKLTMGTKDIPLNELGFEEAYNTSKLLNNIKFDLIICSPLMRAKQTAVIINKNRNNQILFDKRIEERNMGDLEGKPYTNDNTQLWDININTSEYNVETMEDFKNRVYDFINEIEYIYSNKDILLVTHGGVSALINCYFNDSLYEGPISNKFLDNCKYACYNTTPNKNNNNSLILKNTNN